LDKYNNKIRILVVDDITEVRHSIANLVKDEKDMEVVGFASNGQEAIESYELLLPDIMTTCICMPIMDGITATGAITKKHPDANIIIITVQNGYDYMRRAMLAGAKDFLPKPASKDELIVLIRKLAYNKVTITSDAVESENNRSTIQLAPQKQKLPGNNGDKIITDLSKDIDWNGSVNIRHSIRRKIKESPKKKDHPDYVTLYHGPTVRWSTWLKIKKRDHEIDMTILAYFILVIICIIIGSISQ
jgi:YesN/AraC family two-component response regulator